MKKLHWEFIFGIIGTVASIITFLQIQPCILSPCVADPRVTDFQIPFLIEEGEEVNYSIRIHNFGKGTATNCDLFIYDHSFKNALPLKRVTDNLDLPPESDAKYDGKIFLLFDDIENVSAKLSCSEATSEKFQEVLVVLPINKSNFKSINFTSLKPLNFSMAGFSALNSTIKSS